MSALEAEARSVVEEVFPGAQFAEHSEDGPDLRFRYQGRWHEVEAKRCSPSGPDLGGSMLFLAAMNQLNKVSASSDTALVLVLLTDRVTETTTQHLHALRHLVRRPPTVVVAGGDRAFLLAEDAPQGRWLDRCGFPAGEAIEASSPASAGGPLSDAQRLLLRCLLVHPEHPSGWWGGPRGPWRAASELAVLGPTPSTISRALARFTTLHWLKWPRKRALQWLLPGAAVEHLVTQASLARRSLVPMRHLSGGSIREKIAKMPLRGLEKTVGALALGGWHAIAIHERAVIMDVSRKPVVLKGTGSAQTVANALDCVVDPEDPTFFYEICPAEDLVGRSHEPFPLVDLIQAACDVASDPDQGLQQGTEIRRCIEEPW